MPQRGINFNFEANEVVLCFEPDPTKAKVLYYAKILEQSVGNKDRRGRRKPEYMIHFQGWNSSWDRIVPESYVLKNDDTNRSLMRRLANIARQVKRNKTRRRRIDDLLKKHFKRSRLHSDSDSDSDRSTSDDSETDFEDNEQHSDMDIDEEDEEKEAEEQLAKRQKLDTEDDDGEQSEGSSQATEQTSDNDEEDEDDDEQQHHIDLELPENLRKKLEEDCLNIQVHHKLVNLPASPNIVTVLEAYVKNFGVNVLCATGEKNRGNNQCIPPDRNIFICKELVDGLRVMFDFTLPTTLLYNAERQQYAHIMKYPPSPASLAVTVKQEEMEEEEEQEEEEEEHEPVLRSRGRRRSSQRLNSPPASSPILPKLWPSDKEDKDEDGDETPRRITRHAYQEEVRKTHRDSSGGSGRATRSSGGPSTATATAAANNNNNKSLAERVTPPPPLLIPSHISSQTSSGPESQPTTPTAIVPGHHDVALHTKEAAVNSIFSWKMFSDVHTGDNTPCMIYGPHHLLRLFVKLPDILTEMRLPDISLKHLLRHLELFIDYLSNRSEELFPETVYVDAADIYG